MTEYVYHATLDKNLSGIQKKGLIPSENPNWGGDLGANSYGKVFLATNPKQAIYYGEVVQEHSGYDCETLGEQERLVKTCYPEIILLRIQRNRVEDAIGDYVYPAAVSDMYLERTIPPEDIEYLHGKQCWKPLTKAKPSIIEGISMGEWRDESEELDQMQKFLREAVEECENA